MIEGAVRTEDEHAAQFYPLASIKQSSFLQGPAPSVQEGSAPCLPPILQFERRGLQTIRRGCLQLGDLQELQMARTQHPLP